jgi:hypothetical protein
MKSLELGLALIIGLHPLTKATLVAISSATSPRKQPSKVGFALLQNYACIQWLYHSFESRHSIGAFTRVRVNEQDLLLIDFVQQIPHCPKYN